MTLLAVYNSEGCVGRCDARCYNARHPDCDCICGGKNHGVGLNVAIDNTVAEAEAWIEAYRIERPELAGEFRVDQPQAQRELFDTHAG